MDGTRNNYLSNSLNSERQRSHFLSYVPASIDSPDMCAYIGLCIEGKKCVKYWIISREENRMQVV